MSLPAPPWPYAFWPARLDLALTGLPPSGKDSAPPLDALRPRFVQAALLGYVLPIAKAVLLPGFFSAKLGNLPFSERLYPGTKRKRGGRPSTRSQGSGWWSLTRAIQETIQSKASKKKQKDSQSSRDSSRRQVLQRKLSIQREDRVVVVNRGREQLIRQDGIPLLHVFGLSFSCVDASKAAPSPPPPSALPVGYLRGLELRDCLLNVPYLTYRSIR